MQRQATQLIISFVTLIACLSLSVPISLAQQSQPPANATQQQPQSVPSPSPSPDNEDVRPLYGLQGVLVETLSGKVVASQFEEQQFNPASPFGFAAETVTQVVGFSGRCHAISMLEPLGPATLTDQNCGFPLAQLVKVIFKSLALQSFLFGRVLRG